MKQCAICGHAAERGSICHDCRAAIKRARDQTVSQFQSLPTFAMAGAAALPEMRLGRSSPDRRGARPHPPRVKPAVQPTRKTRVPMAPVQGSVLLEVPAGTRSAPFVWVIVTLMVFVVTYVAYRVIVTASETLAAEVPAATAQEEAPAATRPQDVPAMAPLVSLTPAAPATSAATTAPMPSSHVTSAVTTAPTPASHVTEPIAKTMPSAKPAERRPTVAASPAPEVRSLPAAKDTTPSRDDAASTRAAGNAAPARNEGNAFAEARPQRAAGSAATARSRDNSRSDHWQRMAASIRACAGQDFLGGMLCEQKVRIEYCEGYWGQMPECPGGVANDHGQ